MKSGNDVAAILIGMLDLILDSPAVDPRSNLGSGTAFLMSEDLMLYTTSPVVIC